MKIVGLAFMIVTISNCDLFPQKLSGVYYGALISPKNAVVIKTKGSEVKGIVYLSESEHLNLSGLYFEKLLKGTISLANGKKASLIGELAENRLRITLSLPDDSVQVTGVLEKITSNEEYEISSLFSDNWDPLLLGRWESFKIIESSKELGADLKIAIGFQIDGIGYKQFVSLPSELKPVDLPGNDINMYIRREIKWSTHKNELSIVAPSADHTENTLVYRYAIQNDTLRTWSTLENSIRYYRRSKRK